MKKTKMYEVNTDIRNYELKHTACNPSMINLRLEIEVLRFSILTFGDNLN